MPESFGHGGFEISYVDLPADDDAEPVLLIHGFASSLSVNWIGPSWTATLAREGYRVVAFDNRGHGQSSKSYDPADYSPEYMSDDAAALLDHLGVRTAHVMGYSMGARIAAYLALRRPELVATLVFGGLGSGMVDGVGDWDPIADALLADDPASVTHPRGKAFRSFADQTRSDRRALAACIETSRSLLAPSDLSRISQPALVAVGTRDDIGGMAAPLAALLPNGESFDIPDRDHMLAVGDRAFKARVIAFLRAHPLP